jgi:hypothetical protein
MPFMMREVKARWIRFGGQDGDRDGLGQVKQIGSVDLLNSF